MKFYIYKLRFQGPTHFGDTGIDLENVNEWISSDTLFSALVNAMCTMKGEEKTTEFVKRFENDPPFLISSLFLYNNDQLFLPRPLADDNINKEIKQKMGKELKKLKWLTVDGFYKWIQGEYLNLHDVETMKSVQDSYKEAFTVEIKPKVTLDRASQNSSIYHCGYVYFNEKAGLYGLVTFNDEDMIKEFEILLKNLGEIGIGGEKTYGCGMFKVSIFVELTGTLRNILENKSERFILLSLYHPSNDEKETVADNLIAYDLVRKKGWISSGRYALPLKRKSVGFITEGSVLRTHVKGCLVDVTPDKYPPQLLHHKVYRYGYAFTAPSGRLK
jgi:CRISPR-associated protein Csm4